MSVRICLWSGPRNVSTALMYSFAQRADTRVFDEPLYAHYLASTDADSYHPGAAEVLAAQDNDGARVVREVVLGEHDRPVLFFKHMAHHLVELDLDFLERTTNVFLTRDPREMLASFVNQVTEPKLEDTGYPQQVALLDRLLAMGQDPPVLDGKQLLLDPAKVLATLCERVGIPFDAAMLEWTAGPRPEDGVWAPHWYANVHRSTGFAPYRPKSAPFPERLKPLLERCAPLYERLAARAIRA